MTDDLTSGQQYWLAYLDDRVAADMRQAAGEATAPAAKVARQSGAFQYAFQAAILTRQFGLAERADWIEVQSALGGPEEFITPLVEEMDKTARGFESRGERDQASNVRDRIWSELAFLLRIDPARLPDLQARFASERPGESFDLFLAEQLVAGRPVLPEGTLRPPAVDGPDVEMRSFLGGWRLLEVWNTACQACRATLAVADTLAREFPGRVFAIAAHDLPEQVRLYLADAGFTVPAAVAPDEVVRQLGARTLPAHIIVAPDGRFVPLSGTAWEDQARRILSTEPR